MIHPYASRAYAEAFGGEYVPLHLPSADVWVLRRPIPGTDRFDAMGCYPRCPLPAHADLAADFAHLAGLGIVSLTLVTDAFFHPAETALKASFDLCRAYKSHYVHVFSGEDIAYGKHHRYEVRRARRLCETRVVDLREHLDAWFALYRTLVAKHAIAGVQDFPLDYFRAVAELPGLTTTAAFVENRLVSAHLWLEHEGYAYSHLAASSDEGYALRAAYAIYDEALQYFAGRAKAVDFGAGAGASEASAGLSFFKKGFSNAEATAYLCGKVLDAEAYRMVCEAKGVTASGVFFPAYRS